MESVINKSHIGVLREQIEAMRLRCDRLAEEFGAAGGGPEQLRIAREYKGTRRRIRALQALLEMLEREEAAGAPVRR